VHRFIGNFRNNLYDGQGQLVTGKDIYVGEFKEGLRHGTGKNQGEFNYDGEWQNGRPEGSGVLRVNDQEFIAKFLKGDIDESQEVTIRYTDGTMYTGFVKERKPHGRGCLIDEQATKAGEFRDGQLLQSEGEEKPSSPQEQEEKPSPQTAASSQEETITKAQ
jgi:hypothetical protein